MAQERVLRHGGGGALEQVGQGATQALAARVGAAEGVQRQGRDRVDQRPDGGVDVGDGQRGARGYGDASGGLGEHHARHARAGERAALVAPEHPSHLVANVVEQSSHAP